MPAVHYSAFEAGGAIEEEARENAYADALRGFEEQAENVGTAIAAIVERACDEGTPLLVEGVHVVPGSLAPELRARCVAVEALLAVEGPELHRGHFALRAAARPAERYLAGFDAIRHLQDFLLARARQEGIAVIDNANADQALGRLMGLVLDAVGRIEEEEEQP